MQTPLLIVNADDYGLTPGVSAGIRRAALTGIVTSTTAMMNQPDVMEALPLALGLCPRLGLGVHLTLTIGRPLLPAAKVRSLLDENGSFYRQQTLIDHLSEVKPEEALAEWSAQVEKFISVTGKNPDHLDSHHHSSYFTPGLFKQMLVLAKKYACPIRLPYGKNLEFGVDYLKSSSIEDDLQLIQELLSQFCPSAPDTFCGDFYDESVNQVNLHQILHKASQLEIKSTEIMCHPAEVDEILRSLSSYAEPRARELAVLTDPQINSFISSFPFQLSSFSDL
jgi:chitin disaccharide deacetylase